MRQKTLGEYSAIFLGGCLGGMARYGVGLVLNDGVTLMGTTVVNLIGSFLLAVITYGLAQRLSLPNWLILGLGTGFVGAFTTFSTFMNEAITTAGTNPVRAAIFMLVNLIGGFLLATAGLMLSRKWVR